MSDLAGLRNLGPRTAAMLREVGIETPDELAALGAVIAWRRLRFRFGRRVTRIALYALAGAMTGDDWRHLPEPMKAELDAIAAADPPCP